MTLFSAEDVNARKHEKPNLKGDRLNILVLICMYVIQSIPRGFAMAIPLILQNRHATYQEQAEFSLVQSSYSFKLLWAPIIDCTYFRIMGRRKSWVIPLQYLIGTLLLLVSFKIDVWMGSDDGTQKPRIHLLTVTFFICILCCSMQDVAVDGWSLTMLQKRNVGHSGTCNSVGYAIGVFLSYVLFIILDSKDLCNYFRAEPLDHGFIQFSNFILYWSVAFLVATTLIFLFKKDNSLDGMENDLECRLGLKECYVRLWQIVKIKSIQKIGLLLLTCMIFTAPITGVGHLKLMDAGVPRDKYVLLSIPTLSILLTLPFLLSGFLTKHRALNAFLMVFIVRICFHVVYGTFIFFTPHFKTAENTFPAWYYGVLLLCYTIDSVSDYAMWMTTTAFTSHVADPRFGAMYATLSNTLLQIGSKWSITFCIRMVNLLTFRSCNKVDNVCTIKFDGFYVEILIFFLMGCIWIYWARKQICELKYMDSSAFRIPEKTSIIKNCLLRRSKN